MNFLVVKVIIFSLSFQITALKHFTDEQTHEFEKIQQMMCRGKIKEIPFFLDVLQMEVFIRLVMDVKKVSYQEAEKLIS